MRTLPPLMVGVVVLATGALPSEAGHAAEPPFALAGETVFLGNGSVAGRFVIDHTFEIEDMGLVTSAERAIVMVFGPAGFRWVKNEDINQSDWGEDFFPLTEGTYFIYMASSPPMPMAFTMRFINETGRAEHTLSLPVWSQIEALEPTTLPATGEGMVVSKWTSTQPIPGNAYSNVYRRALYQPSYHYYHEEYRWSLPEGVYNCFAYDAGGAIPGNFLNEEGYSFEAHDLMHHNGTATLEMFKYSIGVPTSWLTIVYWVERLPDDLPRPGARSWQGWAKPQRLPGGLGSSLEYDYACLSYRLPRTFAAWSTLAGEQLGNAGLGVRYYVAPSPV